MKLPQPHGHYIDLSARDGATVRTFIAEPRQAPRAALVVLQHMDLRRPGSTHTDRSPNASALSRPGVSPHARHMCEAFALEGYLALAPSTFGWGVWGRDYGFRIEPAYWSSRLSLPLAPPPEKWWDTAPAVLLAAETVRPPSARRFAPRYRHPGDHPSRRPGETRRIPGCSNTPCGLRFWGVHLFD